MIFKLSNIFNCCDIRRYQWRNCTFSLGQCPLVKHSIAFEIVIAFHWSHNGSDCVSNHQPYDCLLNHLFRRRSKKTPKLSLAFVRGIHPAQMASNAEMFPFDDVIMETCPTLRSPLCLAMIQQPCASSDVQASRLQCGAVIMRSISSKILTSNTP